MYESPIKVFTNQYNEFREQIDEQLGERIMEVIAKYGIVVDKEELVKALNYDRQQYEKGYADGQSGRWISCKERLPSDDEPNEVYCINKYGVQMVGSVWERDGGFVAANEESFMCDVVAWMPSFGMYREDEYE